MTMSALQLFHTEYGGLIEYLTALQDHSAGFAQLPGEK
jgi:hypothetical protein